MLAIAALCLAPFIAAYVAYFYWSPQARSNYGELIPARPLIDPALQTLDGQPFKLSQLRGKWILLQLDGGACAAACRDKLYAMRQVRLAQGKEMARVESVWLILDNAQLETMVIREYDTTHMLRAVRSPILSEFPAPDGATNHVYLVDPLGNLMLRFPKNADPGRMQKDLARLLRASRVG